MAALRFLSVLFFSIGIILAYFDFSRYLGKKGVSEYYAIPLVIITGILAVALIFTWNELVYGR